MNQGPPLWGIPCCLLLLLSAASYGQSETHDFITYDTIVKFSCNTGVGGCMLNDSTPNVFTVRISRPRNYFVAGNPDTTSRPWLVTTSGEGEIGTDTNFLVKYGPHYWMANGWDGGVRLENGMHYPILITFIETALNVRAPFLQALMDTLIKYYHPRANSLHMASFSMGLQCVGWYLGYEQTPGDEHNMANVRSLADLEGLAPSGNFLGASPYAFPTFLGHWARKYGGHFFGMEGTNDDKQVYLLSDNINDSMPGNAYFTYEAINGGTHCCWNNVYQPEARNWQCVPPITNTQLPPSRPAHPNMMGDYTVDPETGTGLFQWMLRQGDTTLTVAEVPPPPKKPVVNAGPDQTVILPDDSIVVRGFVTDAGATVVSFKWSQVAGESAVIESPTSVHTAITGLKAGSYAFALTATDYDSKTGSDTLQVTVADSGTIVPPPPPPPPMTSAGANQTLLLPQNSATLSGTAIDSGATIVSWSWSQISGPSATIVNASSATTTIANLSAGTYDFEVTATNNYGATGSATVLVTVMKQAKPPVSVPVVYAGPNRTITLPQDSILVTGVATDTAGKIISLNWAQAYGPAADIVDPSAGSTAIIGLQAGSYAFALSAKDSSGSSGSDTMLLTVLAPTTVVTPPPTDSAALVSLKLYPNPAATGQLTVYFRNSAYGPLAITISDGSGRLVRQYAYTKQDALFDQQLEVAALEKGFYIVRVKMQGYSQTKPFVRL